MILCYVFCVLCVLKLTFLQTSTMFMVGDVSITLRLNAKVELGIGISVLLLKVGGVWREARL